MTSERFDHELYSKFDLDWYYSRYHATIDKLRNPGEDIFDFYTRVGARLGHDPHEDFCEILYRHRNQDIYVGILRGQVRSGYAHFVEIGYREVRRGRPSAAEVARTREICAFLDPSFIEKNYSIDPTKYISAVDFYFMNVTERQISPSALFSEVAYRRDHADVDEAIKIGRTPSGLAHYLSTLGSERRTYVTVAEYEERLRKRELEEKRTLLEAAIPGITHPHAFDMLARIAFFTKNIRLEVEEAQGPGMIVLVPHFMPEILFGGYIAFFEFLSRLKALCRLDLRLIVFNGGTPDSHKQNVMRMKFIGDKRADIFSQVQFLASDHSLRIPEGSDVVSYCAETHYVADRIARRLNVVPYFFIQDYEPDFHGSGDGQTFTKNAFSLPHYGIYNSQELCTYFLGEGELGRIHGDEYEYCVFENHVKKLSADKETFIQRHLRKRKRRLVVYGRPEQHAARNHFATFILGLQLALEKGHFDGNEWEFVSIGSLVYEDVYPLDATHRLEILTKMPEADYVDFLEGCDIGVSLISTPHPGIVHFQMANYGLVTVTNTTKSRSAEWLRSVNANLVGVELSPTAIAVGLETAIAQSTDLDRRYENARAVPYLSKDECMRAALEAVASRLGRRAIAA